MCTDMIRMNATTTLILHVCGTIDVEAKNSKGEPLVQLQLEIPKTYRSIIRNC